MKVTFLGTGTSVGVPRIACDCAVCASTDPRNKRLRCSLWLEQDGRSILIDTTPDLRTQVLRAGIRRLDGVLLTHGHADHLHGLDDVRCFGLEHSRPLPCYADRCTIQRIRTVFDYAFRTNNPSSVPRLALHQVDGPFNLAGFTIVPVPLLHGRQQILGYRIGDLAYLTDCSDIPQASMPLLQRLEVLVLGALRDHPHPTHFSLDQAVAAANSIAAGRTLLTHISHSLDHATTNARLPASVQLSYDGLTLSVSG